jgi:hypothetical protein
MSVLNKNLLKYLTVDCNATKTNLVTLGVNREEKLFCSERDAGIFFLKNENRALVLDNLKSTRFLKHEVRARAFPTHR